MKTKILTLLVLLAIAIVSCQKDQKEAVPQDVTFGIEQIDPSGLKALFDCPVDANGIMLVPATAEIIISGTTYNPAVFYLGGKLYTQAIKLAPGTYSVTKFVLLAADGTTIVMATPNANAAFAEYVTPTLPFEITVSAFTKTEVPIDVLCFEAAKYTQFGFFWFQVDEIIIREKCFFGDLCVKNPLEYTGSLYASQPTGLQIDMPAIFKIHAYKGSVAPANQLPNSPFTNATAAANWGVGAPVCVKWPDLIRVDNEVFIFELWIYVAVGNIFDYVKFHTWTFQDDDLLTQGGQDGVIDFVLGNCNYSSTDLQLAPYMNLPLTATVNIAHPGNPGYWNLGISNLLPSGLYDLPTGAQTGWCGDAFTTVTPGNKTMSIYNSLYPATWPAGMPFNAATINKVNWMFNNLQAYGFPAIVGNTIPAGPGGPLTQPQGLIIQDAIWYIIHNGASSLPQGYNTDLITATLMASGAAGNETFTPLPGGWAAILMVPHTGNPSVPDPTKAQLIFTVVDP